MFDHGRENGPRDVVRRAACRRPEHALEPLVAKALAARALAIRDAIGTEGDHVLRADLDLFLLVRPIGYRAQRRATDLEPAHGALAREKRPGKAGVGQSERMVAGVVHAVSEGEETIAHARQPELLVHMGEQTGGPLEALQKAPA